MPNEIELPLWSHSIDGWGAPETEQFNEIDLPTSIDWTFGVILTWSGAKIKAKLVNHDQIKLNLNNLKELHTPLLGNEIGN